MEFIRNKLLRNREQITDRDTTLGDYSLSSNLLQDLESFITTIGKRNCTAHFDVVTTKGKYLKGRPLGQKPERFIEDHLIFPVLQTLGHSLRPRPVQYAPRWQAGGGIPDFSLTTVPTTTAKDIGVRLFGESKTPNKLQYAQNDVAEYLKKDLDFHAIALLTDGIEWELWIRPRNQPLKEEYAPYRRASLRSPLTEIKIRNIENGEYQSHKVREKIDTDAFTEFTVSSIVDVIQCEFDLDLPSE